MGKTSLHYCDKCGRILATFSPNEKCDCCGTLVKEVPEIYRCNFRWRDGDGHNALVEEIIKKSPNFDPYLFEHREEILAEKSLEIEAKLEAGRNALNKQNGNNKGVVCPYCKSTNVRQVGTVGRMLSVGIFGLASSKIGKQWHCNGCGSNF